MSEHEVHPLAASVDEDMLWERAGKLDVPVAQVKLYDALVMEIENLKDEIRQVVERLESQDFQYEHGTQRWFRTISSDIGELSKMVLFAFLGLAGLIGYLIWKLNNA
jgi:hypothetical protein